MLRKSDTEKGRILEHKTFREIDAPLTIQPIYIRENGPPVEGEKKTVWLVAAGDKPVDIFSPWRDQIQVNVQVPKGVPGLTQVQLFAEHHNVSTGFKSNVSVLIDAESEWQGTGNLTQDDVTIDNFRYRYSVRGESQLQMSPWVLAAGDTTLLPPVLAVQLRTSALNLGTDYLAAIVNLTYNDPEHDYTTTDEFFIDQGSTNVVWLVPRVNPNLSKFTYTMKLIPPTGTEVDMAGEGDGENLLLRPPS